MTLEREEYEEVQRGSSTEDRRVSRIDTLDYALIGAFLLTLVTILAMTFLKMETPEHIFTIFWSLAIGVGLKKAPSTMR